MIAYLLLVNISPDVFQHAGLAGGIARDIREGTLKKYLLQPLDMIGYLVSYRVAHKVSYIVSSSIPYAILFFALPRLLRAACADRPLDLAGVCRVAGRWRSWSGSSSRRASGMVGFWFLEVTSLLYIVMTLNFFISGHMLPLDLLPPFVGRHC